MLEIGLLAAFLGGVLSLLSPCSALLLPAFFAYAFGSPTQLLARTGAFYAGLVTLLVPLGMGVGALSLAINANRQALILAAGVTLVALGLVQLLGRGFGFGPLARLPAHARGDSTGAVYVLGMTYAFAGFCSGPILGGVLTVAATSGTPARGALLLAVYALGMAAPAFLLALGWDRLGTRGRTRLRGRERRVGSLTVHPASIISGLLFIIVGGLFIGFEGTLGLTGVYERIGATGLGHELDAAARALGAAVPDWLVAIAVAAAVGVIATLGVRARRRSRASRTDPGSRPEGRGGPVEPDATAPPSH